MKEKLYPIFHFVFGVFLIILYRNILPKFYFGLFQNINLNDHLLLANFIHIGYYLLITILLILLFYKSLKEEWKNFWKNKKACTKEGMSAWVKGFGLMIIGNIIVLSITSSMAQNESLNRKIIESMPIYAITSMCILGPFIEEIIFRKSFRKAFQNKYFYIFTTAFIFASLHVMNSFNPLTMETFLANWRQLFFLIPYSSLAIFFALSYWKTNTIFTSFIAHSFHNTITVFLIILVSSIGVR